MVEGKVKPFNYSPSTNRDGIVKLPISTLQLIKEKAESIVEDVAEYLENSKDKSVLGDVIAKASYIVGATKYYLGDEENEE